MRRAMQFIELRFFIFAVLLITVNNARSANPSIYTWNGNAVMTLQTTIGARMCARQGLERPAPRFVGTSKPHACFACKQQRPVPPRAESSARSSRAISFTRPTRTDEITG